MVVAVLVAAVVTGAWVMSSRPRAVALSSQRGTGSSSTAALPTALSSVLPGTVPLSSTSAAVGADVPGSPGAGGSMAGGSMPGGAAISGSLPASDVVVDVAGRVRRPGLYHLPAGSRIDDAITAAGGPRRGVDLADLNLAALLADGQQIVVGPHAGVVGAPAVDPAASDLTAAGTTAPVSLNTATLEELETLPRVGPVTAQKILDYRAAHGNFTSIDQLKDISGIGDVTFAGLAPLVTL
jgi:competence protein ComEA